MTETFQNAPLVEIVAELRWPIPQVAGADQAGNPVQLPIPIAFTDNTTTALFHQVTAAVGKRGFDRLEELAVPAVPMPVMLQQMVYRYRRSDEVPVLAQIGPGMFSVNALPPYKSWEEFRPLLEGGIDSLLEAIAEAMAAKPELTVILRYIDAFKPDLTGGRDARTFATEVMGFRLDLPTTLQARLTEGVQARASFQMALPIPEIEMTITVSDGFLGAEPVVLMNNDVRLEKTVSAEKQAIVDAFDKAHDLLHGTFADMTQSIRDKLQPIPTREDT